MEILRRPVERTHKAMSSPIDTTELLGRLNDREEQEMGYPAIDDYEDYIDFAATDVLHGWRDDASGDSSKDEAMFADAFANAFRVLVLEEGQQVFRRTGFDKRRYVWRQTGHIVGWTVSSCQDGDVASSPDGHDEQTLKVYGSGRERWFATAGEAAERAREIIAVAGGHLKRERVVVRGIELPAPEPLEIEEAAMTTKGDRK